MAGSLLIAAFGGAQQIAEIVKSFDFSKIDVRNKSKKDYLTVGLAPSFGKLNSATVKMMDDNLKVMIAGATKLIAQIRPEERSWEKIVGTLMQSTLLEPMGDEIHRSDKLIKTQTNYFKFDGSPDETIVREVHSWFVKLINDSDVLASTQINIDVLGRIVAQTGATIESFETFFTKHEHHEKTMLDIGVLRYPDIEHPYFKLYRIKLVAWSDSSRLLFVQDDRNGITGEFHVRRFKPRASVIAKMKEESIKHAVSEADALFPEESIKHAVSEADALFP